MLNSIGILAALFIVVSGFANVQSIAKKKKIVAGAEVA